MKPPRFLPLAGLAAGCPFDKLFTGGPDPPPGSGYVGLVFATQPRDATAGTPITPPVQVSLRDSTGNADATFNGPVTVALGANPGNDTLSGTKTANAVNGVATFSDLRLAKAASGYKLTAASAGMPTAASTAFRVEPGSPTKLVFTAQPTPTM